MIFRSNIPVLYSENVRRSIDYYTKVLGFEHKWEWDDPPTFGGVSRDLVEIYFCEKSQGHPGTWVYLILDKVDELYERAKANGAKILSAPENREWGMREMLVEDPDGHVLRCAQPVGRHREKSGHLPENIILTERIPTVSEYQKLVKAVDWSLKQEAVVEKLLKAPVYSIVAEEASDKNVIGCVLLLGDGASFYYVKDMMVEPQYQNKHIGTALMQKVHEWLEEHAAPDALVGLYTGENLAPFYRQFGFRESFGMTRRIRK